MCIPMKVRLAWQIIANPSGYGRDEVFNKQDPCLLRRSDVNIMGLRILPHPILASLC